MIDVLEMEEGQGGFLLSFLDMQRALRWQRVDMFENPHAHGACTICLLHVCIIAVVCSMRRMVFMTT